MDFLKTLLAYMATTLIVAVESTATPSVTPVPTPSPTPGPVRAAVTETAPALPTPKETETPEPSPSVTPVPVPTITPNMKGYHNLLQGDRGEEVKRLQKRLIELGYLAEGSADGAFGGRTREAVRRFQYYNGLTVDGIAGRTTQTNLFENPDAAPYPTETPTPEPTAAPTPEPAETSTPEPAETAAAETTTAPADESAAEPESEAAGTPEPEAAESPEPGEAKPASLTGRDGATPEPAEEAAAADGIGGAAETASPEPEEGLIEEVNLDEQETASPELPAAAAAAAYEDVAGWVRLNDSEDTMQWTELEEGTPVVRSPRLQKLDEDIRVSLDDLCSSLEGWELTDEGHSLVLLAQGYTLALVREDSGIAAMVDGMEMAAEPLDFEFGEGHFIRAGFLAEALDGSWEWDAEDETLILRIAQRDSAERPE